MFGSNLARERCAMWIEVLQLLPLDCRWIMSRDFNMVERPLDMSSSSCSQLMGLREELIWIDIKTKYNIKDYLVGMMAQFTLGITIGMMALKFL